MDLSSIFTQMALLFAVIALGYIATKCHVLDANSNRHFSNLVICITNPCTVLHSVLAGEHVLTNAEVFQLTGFSFGVFGFMVLVAPLVVKLLRIREDAGLYRFMIVFSNVGFIGFPVVRAVFGANAVFYAAIYNLVFQLVLYTYGVRQISRNPADRKIGWRMFCKPIIIASLLAYVFYLVDFRAPAYVVNALGLVDQLTSPLSMLVIGCALAQVPVKNVFNNWRTYPFIAIKQLLLPVICFLILRLFVANQLILGMLTIMTLMPIANMAAMFCAKYDGNQPLAASTTFVSTLFSLIGIPILMFIFFPA